MLFAAGRREDTIDEAAMMQRQMSMNPMAAMTFDAKAAFKTETVALGAAEHEWALADAEARALEVLQRLGVAAQ